jgi:hypothetical protein
MKHKLTEKHRAGVRRWLKFNKVFKTSSCPFINLNYDCAICYSWFPRIGCIFCPCSVYGLGEVIKIAKKMLVYPGYAKENKK